MVDSAHKRIFLAWLSEMEIDVLSPHWRAAAAKWLGKSERMMGYYFEGKPIPADTLMLMDALAQGYRPKRWARS
jgi:hypothetical protein